MWVASCWRNAFTYCQDNHMLLRSIPLSWFITWSLLRFRNLSIVRASWTFLLIVLPSFRGTLASQWILCPVFSTCLAMADISVFHSVVWSLGSFTRCLAILAVSPTYTFGHSLHPVAYITPGVESAGRASFAPLITLHFLCVVVVAVLISSGAKTIDIASLIPLT